MERLGPSKDVDIQIFFYFSSLYCFLVLLDNVFLCSPGSSRTLDRRVGLNKEICLLSVPPVLRLNMCHSHLVSFLILNFYLWLFYKYVCLPLYVYVSSTCMPSACSSQRASDPLGLEFQKIVSHVGAGK